MISINDELMIDSVLSKENAGEIVRKLVYKYADISVKNARDLLSMISDITDKALAIINQEAISNKQAAFWLMAQRDMSCEMDGTFFASMIPVCQVIFPYGKCENNRSEAEKKYWALFLKHFKNKNVFSWERDKTWADNYGYTQYLQSVESNMETWHDTLCRFSAGSRICKDVENGGRDYETD